MKNKTRKKLSLVLAAVLSALLLAGAEPPSLAAAGGAAAPDNVAICKNESQITLNGKKLTCYAKTDVISGYTAYVEAKLEENDGSGWSTAATWTDKGGLSATVDETHTAQKGCTYRLSVTHKAYNSAGKCVETIKSVTDEVTY